MSLPRPFFAARLALAMLSSDVKVTDAMINIAREAALTEDMHRNARGHGHGAGRNNPGSFRKPGTGKKYRVRN